MSLNKMTATVAVDNTYFSLDTDYSYLVPPEMENTIAVGAAVTVPFGRGDRKRDGIVVALAEAEDAGNMKMIAACGEQVLSEEMVLLALWLKERCFCTTYDCLRQMLPRGFGRLKAKSERMVRLTDEYEAVTVRLTPKQQTVVDLLLDVGTAGANEICAFCSVGMTVLKNLEKYGVIAFYEKEVYRNPYPQQSSEGVKEPIALSAKQQAAYEKLSAMMTEGGNALLYGVTGSGKTQVYLRLIDKALENGRDVIVMVPEIALTPQTLAIFHRRYGNQIAVLHSGLSLGERNDEYKRADRGEVKIVIGTRSAVFAPLHHLGLIIMDEEQEHTYKSERTPRYYAGDVAKFRAKYHHALFLMTSATPSLTSYSNALKGNYTLCELDERYGDSVLPEVIVVDMKAEMKLGNRSPISAQLKQLLSECLDSGKQAILLINRRGYNTFIACNECGHIVTCPNCSISLTYHSFQNRLVCHYCGYSKQLDNVCPSCGSHSVRYSGYGTQRIEDELSRLFPSARVLRMDADTTTAKFAHQKLLDAFAAGDYDILVGTQMVAKGLDFDNVTLVGVVNADNSLYDESYMAAEKSFDLITQVVGRAGRRGEKGKAVIQTINPYNEIIEFAAEQDYKSFYQSEIAMRKIMIYPPYCDIFSACFTGENENSVALCAKAFFEKMVALNAEEFKDVKLYALGPTPAKIAKLNNHYRYRLALKIKNNHRSRLMMTELVKYIYHLKEYKDVTVSVDINPIDLS